MDIKEVAQGLVAMCNEGKFHEAIEAYYGENIVSVEGDGTVTNGLEAVLGKSKWWYENFEVHSASVKGPYVSANGFSVIFNIDATQKSENKRMKMEEVAVYNVENGKIVREEFFYGTE
jgi:hypothetical protein